jgi:diadenosine tetraphosphate (Ap4A) HIT family hydrolase
MDEVLFPNEKIIVTAHFDVHQDREVPIPGFFIVEPLKKMKSVADFSQDEAEEFIKLACALRKNMRDVLGIEDAYLFQNEDSEHGFHLWLFPRHAWMEQFGRKIQSVRPIMNHAKEHLRTEAAVAEVKSAVERMKKAMENFSAFSSSAS